MTSLAHLSVADLRNLSNELACDGGFLTCDDGRLDSPELTYVPDIDDRIGNRMLLAVCSIFGAFALMGMQAYASAKNAHSFRLLHEECGSQAAKLSEKGLMHNEGAAYQAGFYGRLNGTFARERTMAALSQAFACVGLTILTVLAITLAITQISHALGPLHQSAVTFYHASLYPMLFAGAAGVGVGIFIYGLRSFYYYLEKLPQQK